MAVDPASNALVTKEEVKEWLKLSGTDDDDFLQSAINDWSDAIETRLNRVIISADHTDECHPGGKLAVLLKNIPVTEISSITVDDGALGISDYTVYPESGIVRLVSGKAFGGGPGSILVTYTGGYEEAPGDLKRCVKQIVALEYYLSGHGRKALAKRGESTGEGTATYERGPEDQEKIMQRIERLYARR